MTKLEFQKLHGLTDEDMAFICLVKETFNGSIVSIKDVPHE
jgi:hypothetical protein